MTDREKLKSLLNEFGINFKEGGTNFRGASIPEMKNDIEVHAQGKEHKVNGYMGFFCTFEFDDDGKFVQMGIFE